MGLKGSGDNKEAGLSVLLHERMWRIKDWEKMWGSEPSPEDTQS